jgi:hypothetical protein
LFDTESDDLSFMIEAVSLIDSGLDIVDISGAAIRRASAVRHGKQGKWVLRTG